MSEIIKVPRILLDEDLLSFFQRWIWRLDIRGEEVIIDFTNSDFIAPWAFTLFTIYGMFLEKKHGKTVKLKVDPYSRPGIFASKLGIRNFLDANISTTSEYDELRTSQLRKIENSNDITTHVKTILPILSIHDEEIEGAVHYSLTELLRNVVQHSNSLVGGLTCAQFYPKSGLVQIVVADIGIGLKATLSEKYPEIKKDIQAVKISILPHVSGTFEKGAYHSMADNAGLGLFFITQIATRAGGHFYLCSGKAMTHIWGDEAGEEKRVHKEAAIGWPGTFAIIYLKRASIAEFSSLLQVCRDLAAEARKDEIRFVLDFIEEIPELEGLNIFNIYDLSEDVQVASKLRDLKIIPLLKEGQLVVLDFQGIKFATQSFVHALMYKIFRDIPISLSLLSFANCTPSTREAIYAVSAYAKADGNK